MGAGARARKAPHRSMDMRIARLGIPHFPNYIRDMSRRADRIAAALRSTFEAAEVQVVDDSHRHVGHAGAAPGGETHYTVRIVSPSFAGMSRVARSRAVYAALSAEFAGGMHALALELKAPGEA